MVKKYISDYPPLLTEWHQSKNGDIRSETVAHRSKKKVWWKCSVWDDHIWQAPPGNRTRALKPSGCPFCSGAKADRKNNLSILFPELLKEWDWAKNNDLDPQHLTAGSNKQVWWICAEGHEYKKEVYKRTSGGGCKYCRNKAVSATNNLEVNFPKIAKEWHPIKNGTLKANQVLWGSGKKVWWLCPRGHVYDAKINNRTSPLSKSGCPLCSNHSSEPEIRILTEAMTIFEDVKSQLALNSFPNFESRRGKLDIYIPKIDVVLEYDGSYFHRGKEAKDLRLVNELNAIGIKVIRVRCAPLQKLSAHDVLVKSDVLKKKDLDQIFSKLIKFCSEELTEKINGYLRKNTFTNEQLFRAYQSQFPSPLPQNSLLVVHPEISKEWDYKKNYPLTPRNFAPHSSSKVYWKCENEHPSYPATIGARTGKNRTSCPVCSGNKVHTSTSLATLKPQIAKQWHPTKNEKLKPDGFTCGSGKIVWWKCENGLDHEWYVSIGSRAGKNRKGLCPFCTNQKVSVTNNFAEKYKELTAELHPNKNDALDATKIIGGAEKVWWRCKNGHSYQQTFSDRKRGHGCSKCFYESRRK